MLATSYSTSGPVVVTFDHGVDNFLRKIRVLKTRDPFGQMQGSHDQESGGCVLWVCKIQPTATELDLSYRTYSSYKPLPK